jgi:DNA modification methylase
MTLSSYEKQMFSRTVGENTQTVIQGDCLEYMKTLADKSFDLVLTSPPYNMGAKSLGYHPNSKTGDNFYNEYEDSMEEPEYLKFCLDVINESLRVGRYVVWNMQMLSGNKNTILDILFSKRDNLKDIFIWNKHAVSVITAKSGVMAKGFEFCFLFGEDDKMVFPYNNFPENGYVPNRQEWFKKESIPEHHATFPMELPLYFIQHFSKESDTILDPFLGSGTTLVACKQLNRNGVGIEISEEYCTIARKRLEQGTLL